MKEYVFALMFVAAGCGGSGGGSGTPTSPLPAAGPGTGLGGDGSQPPGGNQAECKSIECASSDQARSVLDPNKLVKRCGDGQVMVDDVCATPRALVTEDGVVEFGNVATKGFIYRTNMQARPETPSYIRTYVAPGGSQEDFDFSYYIDGDTESTTRWNQPGLLLSDYRFDLMSRELYFAVPGLYEDFTNMSVDIWGNSWNESSGKYDEARNLCESVIRSYKELFLRDETRFTSAQLPEFFDGQLKYGCRASDPTSTITSISIGIICGTKNSCFVKSLSLYKG